MGRSHNLRGEPSLGLFVKKRNIGAPFWHAVLAVVLVEGARRAVVASRYQHVHVRGRVARPWRWVMGTVCCIVAGARGWRWWHAQGRKGAGAQGPIQRDR